MITFSGARILGAAISASDGQPVVRLKFLAETVEDVAVRLAVPWLRRRGPLEELERGARLQHTVKKIHELKLTAEKVVRFRAFRPSEDSPVLGISFLAVFSGSVLDIIEHVLACGGGKGTCTVETLQEPMFTEQEDEPIEANLTGEALARHRAIQNGKAE